MPERSQPRSGLERLLSPGATAPRRDGRRRRSRCAASLALATVMARKGQARRAGAARARGVRHRLPTDAAARGGRADRVRLGRAGPLARDGRRHRAAIPFEHAAAGRACRASRRSATSRTAAPSIRVSGPKARDALAKGVPIDLHPRAFRSGDAAVTTVAHIGVHLWQLDDTPTYEIAVFRSFARDFWRWLMQCSGRIRRHGRKIAVLTNCSVTSLVYRLCGAVIFSAAPLRRAA